MLQECKINCNTSFETENYKWFVASGVKPEDRDRVQQLKENKKPIELSMRLANTEHQGVGFAVSKHLLPCLEVVRVVSN